MTIRFVRQFRPLFTASVLLGLGMVSVEVVLRVQRPETEPGVAPLTGQEVQSLLVPSATVHHELRRLTTRTVGDVSIEINEWGLRGPSVSNTRTGLRILILGDDTIFGTNLLRQDTISTRLAQYLAKSGVEAEVISGGVPADAPLLSLIRFQREWHKLSPDIVILHFDMSDVFDDAEYRRYLKESNGLQVCQNPMLAGRKPSAFRTLLNSSAVAQWATRYFVGDDSTESSIARRYGWTTAPRQELQLLIRHALRPIGDAATISAGRVIVSTLPVPWQVGSADDFNRLAGVAANSEAWPITADLPQRLISAACQQAGIEFCDSTSAFRTFTAPTKLYEDDSPRLSRFGAAIYARALAQFLTDSRIAADSDQANQG